MKVIIDTNIIISALLYNSAKRSIILLSGLEFYYPKSSQREISKYKEEIMEKAGLTEEVYEQVLNLLFERVHIVEDYELKPYFTEAEKIIGKTDPKDIPFIACALAHIGSVIWSDDKHFDKQNKIKIVKQKDVLEMI